MYIHTIQSLIDGGGKRCEEGEGDKFAFHDTYSFQFKLRPLVSRFFHYGLVCIIIRYLQYMVCVCVCVCVRVGAAGSL